MTSRGHYFQTLGQNNGFIVLAAELALILFLVFCCAVCVLDVYLQQGHEVQQGQQGQRGQQVPETQKPV